jgi:hypothetical protein
MYLGAPVANYPIDTNRTTAGLGTDQRDDLVPMARSKW